MHVGCGVCVHVCGMCVHVCGVCVHACEECACGVCVCVHMDSVYNVRHVCVCVCVCVWFMIHPHVKKYASRLKQVTADT